MARLGTESEGSVLDRHPSGAHADEQNKGFARSLLTVALASMFEASIPLPLVASDGRNVFLEFFLAKEVVSIKHSHEIFSTGSSFAVVAPDTGRNDVPIRIVSIGS